jgi:hypothetical protein
MIGQKTVQSVKLSYMIECKNNSNVSAHVSLLQKGYVKCDNTSIFLKA